jgi:hypothetical protein
MALDGQVTNVRECLNAAYCGKPSSPVDILIRKSFSNAGSAATEPGRRTASFDCMPDGCMP